MLNMNKKYIVYLIRLSGSNPEKRLIAQCPSLETAQKIIDTTCSFFYNPLYDHLTIEEQPIIDGIEIVWWHMWSKEDRKWKWTGKTSAKRLEKMYENTNDKYKPIVKRE